MRGRLCIAALMGAALLTVPASGKEARPRFAEAGLAVGALPQGPLNAITDVPGVKVGHVTRIEGDRVRTGVTAILPHGGNLFQDRVPAGFFRANGHGKLAGSNQLEELGEIESPILLTNTLNVAEALAGGIKWTLDQPGNADVMSVNVIAGETNDGYLNDIRARHVRQDDVIAAITSARSGPVAEGNVGAGTGTRCFAYKGGIGTSSRQILIGDQTYTVGVLVQTNFEGRLTIAGRRFEDRKLASANRQAVDAAVGGGSIMIVVATDAPLSDRNLARLARRALIGLVRTGSDMENSSGDFVLAFSTASEVRRTSAKRSRIASYSELANAQTTVLFEAVTDATEESIYNAMFAATAMKGRDGHELPALPINEIVRSLRKGPAK
jgi:D-aminopeptidase